MDIHELCENAWICMGCVKIYGHAWECACVGMRESGRPFINLVFSGTVRYRRIKFGILAEYD